MASGGVVLLLLRKQENRFCFGNSRPRPPELQQHVTHSVCIPTTEGTSARIIV